MTPGDSFTSSILSMSQARRMLLLTTWFLIELFW